MIPKLEKDLKLNLTCKGSYEYESQRKYPRGLTLKVYNEHVEVAYAIKHWKEMTCGYRVNKTRKSNLTLTLTLLHFQFAKPKKLVLLTLLK